MELRTIWKAESPGPCDFLVAKAQKGEMSRLVSTFGLRGLCRMVVPSTERKLRENLGYIERKVASSPG